MNADKQQKKTVGVPFSKDDPRINRAGRPPGQTLKEYWQKKFRDMTDEEKETFTKRVGNEVIWKMAEGQPKQDTDVTSGGEKITPIFGGLSVLPDNGDKTDIPTQEED
jgi:hypothetical protein